MSDRSEQMPNIVVWTWMSSMLHLSGTELLIFAYIYSVSFDNVHRCYTTLNSMEQWFGLTRQAISRRIQNLVDAEFLTKRTSNDPNSGFIKHNSYSVNMERVTSLCESADFDVYRNFVDSYGTVLKNRFPGEVADIDTYLNNLIQWHKTKDMEVCLTMKQLSDILLCDDTCSIKDIIASFKITKQAKPKKAPSTTKKKQDTALLFEDEQKPKRRSRSAKRNEWYAEKKSMSMDFVYTNLSGNEEILRLINMFLETDVGMSYSPDQWRMQLNAMYEYGITPDRIIRGINTSYMNGYKSLYVQDRSETDMRKKLSAVNNYVDTVCDGNDDMRRLLTAYLFDTPKARSFSAEQFRMVLDELTELKPTLQDKLDSVRISYTRGYPALAYKNQTGGASDQQDIKEKHDAVDEFIASGYYYLVDGLSEALHTYIDATQNGMSMSVDAFKIALSNLRLFCLNDSDKVTKVNLAIQQNYRYFATEDYEETKVLHKKSETRESAAKSADHFRMSRIFAELQRNPKNPKLAGVKMGAGEFM